MESEKFYDKAYDWVLSSGPRVLLGLIILLVGFWLIRVTLNWFKAHMRRKEVDASLKPFFLSLVGIALRVLLVLVVMQIVGIQMTIFAAVIGAVGVAAGLALSGTLQNFASGVLILLLKPFVVGDNIITQNMEGTVTTIEIFYTIVTTFDNRSVIVPNGKLLNEVIINLSREGNRRLDLELKFSYGIEYETIKRNLENAIDDSVNLLHKAERRVGVSALDDDGYKVMVNVWLHAHGYHDARLALQEKIMSYMKKSGVLLPGMEPAKE
ncbi:mechanosensitive ion channel family protein [Daejeonella lutea]|uniref:Small conductance mechanosensitive channel n=1 Tax=Daejeonella lutea TaxID=572036 RepID=A0A1T5BC47_9SPHI|nr:mechanosensitive ion channel family protein [Daejeonella lutea]SKB44715.1 small conductance mechanosensitive channel [Daejeonella lutea]